MKLNDSQKQKFLEVALEAAAKARDFILKGIEDGFSSELKADKTIVTDIDRGAEKLLREELMKAFPDHGIIGEEFDSVNENSAFKWYLDPIDGTFNFAKGSPLYGSLIALEYEGESILGIADHPSVNQLFYAVKGGGAFLNGTQLSSLKQISKDEMKNEIIAICRRECFEKAGYLEPYDWVFQNHNHVRISPSSFGGAQTISGAYSAKADFNICKYDYAPLKVMLSEVGGKLVVLNEYQIEDGRTKEDIIFGNPTVVDYLVEVFSK